MTATLVPLTTHYDPASHVDVARLPGRLNETSAPYLVQPQLPLNYTGLWPLLAGQNASVNMTFLVSDLFETQGIDCTVTSGWELFPRVNRMVGAAPGYQIVQPERLEPVRRISLAEAQRLAIAALLEAEERRQTERQREAAFWAALEDEG